MVFLDTNILLEITLKDRAHLLKVIRYLDRLDDATAISMLSAHLIMHFGRKESVDDTVLQGIINQNELLDLNPDDYMWAVANEQGRDFEDALQIATALRFGCDDFVTLDRSIAKRYTELPINIVTL